MCGRFAVAGSADDIVSFFEADIVGEHLPPPSWNIAPTDPVSIVLDTVARDDPAAPASRRVESARWGLIPTWSSHARSGARAFNARAETAAEKPQFRDAFAKRRAIIPASGYFEWQKTAGEKVPHFVHLPQNAPLLFAGLYGWWRDPARPRNSPDRWVLSATILTRDSGGAVAGLHDRMPVLLSPDLLADWLNPRITGDQNLLGALSAGALALAETLEFHAVGHAVGSPRNNSPRLIEPVR